MPDWILVPGFHVEVQSSAAPGLTWSRTTPLAYYPGPIKVRVTLPVPVAIPENVFDSPTIIRSLLTWIVSVIGSARCRGTYCRSLL